MFYCWCHSRVSACFRFRLSLAGDICKQTISVSAAVGCVPISANRQNVVNTGLWFSETLEPSLLHILLQCKRHPSGLKLSVTQETLAKSRITKRSMWIFSVIAIQFKFLCHSVYDYITLL